jgi:hypothetical protein
MKFSRELASGDVTMAFRRFKRHHTELNNLYWTWAPCEKIALRNVDGADGSIMADVHFSYTGDDSRRVAVPIQQWKDQLKDYANWTRLNVIMAASSYFEVYLQTVVSLSILSRPGVLWGLGGVIDGASFIREKDERFLEDLQKGAIPCVRGEWPKRASAFKKMFGELPATLDQNLGDLDRLRKLRNGIGHSFGRSLDSITYRVDLPDKPMERLSEKRMKKYLGIIMDVAANIDAFLLTNFIGCYELLYYYHKYVYPQYNVGIYMTKTRFLRKSVIQVMGEPHIGNDYLDGLVNFYEALKR